MKALVLFVLIFTIASLLRADDIGLLYALDQDAAAFKKFAGEPDAHIKTGSREITRFSIFGRHVFLLKMGSGSVESAISAEALLEKIHCSIVLAIGPAGGLSDSAKVGSWFRVAQVVAYQKGSWTGTGFEIAPAATFKLLPAPEGWNLPALFKDTPGWTVASGEIFIASDTFREDLRETTHADAVEMNLFGLAAACDEHNVPLYCWRIISDHADSNAGDDFKKFVASYDGAGGRAIAELIKNLPPDPNSPGSYPALRKLLPQ